MDWLWDPRWGWHLPESGPLGPVLDYDTPLFDEVCRDMGSGDGESAVYREGPALDGMTPSGGTS